MFISILSITIWQANLSMEGLQIIAISMVVAFIFVVYSSAFIRTAGENIYKMDCYTGRTDKNTLIIQSKDIVE